MIDGIYASEDAVDIVEGPVLRSRPAVRFEFATHIILTSVKCSVQQYHSLLHRAQLTELGNEQTVQK